MSQMASPYAGILGMIAFVVIMLQAVIDGDGLSGSIQAACVSLVVFATLGFLAGKVATLIVDESVRTQLRDEWQEITESENRQSRHTN